MTYVTILKTVDEEMRRFNCLFRIHVICIYQNLDVHNTIYNPSVYAISHITQNTVYISSAGVRFLHVYQGRTQDLELGGALRAEGRKGGWVREGASPPPAPARGYRGAL